MGKKTLNIEDIRHNLEVAKPGFMYFALNMDKDLLRWVQYVGLEADASRLFFYFESSQNSLNSISFRVYAGVNINDTFDLLTMYSNEIYVYFKALKQSIVFNN
jgi:hypothetical protein